MTQPNTYFTADRDDFAQFLSATGKFDTVLDIGCAAGSLGSQLLESGLAKTVDGIEINPSAAAKAAPRLRTVWIGSGKICYPIHRYMPTIWSSWPIRSSTWLILGKCYGTYAKTVAPVRKSL